MKIPTRSLPILLAALLAEPAAAVCVLCSCSIAIDSNVAFGTYNPLPGTALNAAGHFTVTCDVTLGVLGTYTVALGKGGANSYAPRRMSSGAHTLNYNLYTDAARTTVWGDGTGGTTLVSDPSLLGLLGHYVRAYDVYGRILANQPGTPPGSYGDTIVITVTYN